MSSPKPTSPQATTSSPKGPASPTSPGVSSPASNNAEITTFAEDEAPLEIAEPIQVEDGAFSDADSDYGSSIGSDTTSLSSSVLNYTYENGRRYHAFRSGKYFMPNDETEQDRLDMTHHLWCVRLNGELHLAPLPTHPQKVLDLGTGTGIWAIDFADMYPSAEVTGVDLSPIQPGWVPPNVKFEVDDLEDEWLWAPNSFDYIHSRAMVGSIRNWPRFLEQAYNALKPGGYIELQETDLNLFSDDGTDKHAIHATEYIQGVRHAGTILPTRFDIAPELSSLIQSAGFDDITERKIKQPLGTWAKGKKMKEMGGWTLVIMETGLEAYGLKIFTHVLGWSKDRFDRFLEGVKEDIRNREWHMYSYSHVVYARKPVEE